MNDKLSISTKIGFPPLQVEVKYQTDLKSRNTAQDYVSNIDQKFIDIVSNQLGIGKEIISNDSRFVDDLGADSLDSVELVMESEKEFEIEIPDEDAEKLSTVSQAIEYIKWRGK